VKEQITSDFENKEEEERLRIETLFRQEERQIRAEY